MERAEFSPQGGNGAERNFFRRMKTSNLILLALGLFSLGFIIAMTVIFCVKDAVPDTLIQYTLGSGGVEALLLAGIKVSKILTGDKPGENVSESDTEI